ncbi:hypothetical protein [Corynebacterium sp. NML140438]|uniref:hypothetical protein n=1 Tax=Corynebacterium sp. NML140438 TaxID=1906334 RepID=UPI0011605043|nr:hypothetical protein [Corynebacterium sp. NML140438]
MHALSDNSTLELNVDVFSFVISQGMVADADLLAEQLRGCGVPHSEFARLRVAVSQVAGPRKAVVHVTGSRLALALRPAPAVSPEITMFAEPIRDQRAQPQRRGPDLGWQRHVIATLGTSDGLLGDAHSRIISAVLQPMVTFPSATQAVISGHPATTPSYALQGVVRVLEEAGVETHQEANGFSRFDLMHQETWAVDSVLGARLVEQWKEYGTPKPGPRIIERGALPTHRGVNAIRQQRASLL